MKRLFVILLVSCGRSGFEVQEPSDFNPDNGGDNQPERRYLAGDLLSATTCADGSISMQKLSAKATKAPWALDWYVESDRGGSGHRNCLLPEDAALATTAYPSTGMGPGTSWSVSLGATAIKGDVSGAGDLRVMWRWQSLQDYQSPLATYLNQRSSGPTFLGVETNVPGHENVAMAIIGDMLPKWEYCFDREDADTSRGTSNNWNCAVPGSLNEGDPAWNVTAQKLVAAGGTGAGIRGHLTAQESLKWLHAFAPGATYYLPAHVERAGPYNPNGNNGFNIEHLRDFNDAAPDAAFGFQTQPGHQASASRGDYEVLRNLIDGNNIDSIGGTTYGGTGVYGAQVGGVWDALLGEGRRYWFFASSEWTSRGVFSADDRRSTADFYPGEYQRLHLFTQTKPTPSAIVDDLRAGNAFVTQGQLIDRLAFVACAGLTNTAVVALAVAAAQSNTSPDSTSCATMGGKLTVTAGADVVVGIVSRDPAGTNYSPYVFDNPALRSIGVSVPLNAPVLEHIDLISGGVTGFKSPGEGAYQGEWPLNTDWLHADGSTAALADVPDGAKNNSATVAATFRATDWTQVSGPDGTTYQAMSYTFTAAQDSRYVRLRGTNLAASTPCETGGNGEPLSDLVTNANDPSKLCLPCLSVGSNVPANDTLYDGANIDGCPEHLPTVLGQKYVAYDVAAWTDLWFYSNPIYIEVSGGTPVAGVER